MTSTVKKRSLLLEGHKTSVSLEDPFWHSLKEIAREIGASASDLVARIDASRGEPNLSSAIRMFVLDHFRAQAKARFETTQAAVQDVMPVRAGASPGPSAGVVSRGANGGALLAGRPGRPAV